jgi:sugar transferase (PEP-CTERM system associated)
MVRLFKVFIPVGTLALLFSECLLITGCFVLATYLFVPEDPTVFLTTEGGAFSIGLVVVAMVVGMYLNDLYTEVQVNSKILLVQQLCFVMGSAFLLEALVSYVNRNLRMPLHLMLPGGAMSLVGCYSWRIFFSAYALRAMGGERLLLVGGSPVLQEISRHAMNNPSTGLRVIGFVDDVEADEEPGGPKYLGRLEALREIAIATHPTRIVVGMFERRNRLPLADLLDLRFRGHIVEEAAIAYERISGRVPIRELRPSQLIYSGDTVRIHRAVMHQNTINLVIAVVGLILSAPLMLLTALAVRLSSAGPVLYRQVRVGLHGKPFTLFKFRSMRVDAEAATGAVWAAKNDPRVTSIGRIIRKVRLDELPQLFNVLKGEMSMVGPRPERPEFVQTLVEQIPYYRQRHAVRPGITGWAQINYKYGETLEDTMVKLEYDLYYIKHIAFSLDAYIMLHTLKAMLLSRGAQ